MNARVAFTGYEARMGFQINGIHAVWHEPGFSGVVIHSDS